MTNPIDDQEDRERTAKSERLQVKALRTQQAAEVKALLESPEARRVLWRFLQDAGQGMTVFREGAHAMAHAAGWQDAANWWLNEIRSHCPEREAQMRAEARKRDKTNEDSDANE